MVGKSTVRRGSIRLTVNQRLQRQRRYPHPTADGCGDADPARRLDRQREIQRYAAAEEYRQPQDPALAFGRQRVAQRAERQQHPAWRLAPAVVRNR